MASKHPKLPPKRRKRPATEAQAEPALKPRLQLEPEAKPKSTVLLKKLLAVRKKGSEGRQPAGDARPLEKVDSETSRGDGRSSETATETDGAASSGGLHLPLASASDPLPAKPVPTSPVSKKNAACLVICPSLTPIEPRTEDRLRELERLGYTVVRAKGFSAVEQGRNQLASDALHFGFRETMWIDPDVDFDPDAVERLRSHKLPIVAGVYPQKGSRALSCHVLPGTEKLVFGEEGGLVEVLYASAGFLLVQTAAYKQIRDQLALPHCNIRGGQRGIWPFFQNLVKPAKMQESEISSQEPGTKNQELSPYDPRRITGLFLTHDFAFCERARQAGLKIMADTTLRLWHLGSYPYSWEDAGTDVERFDSYEYYVE